jgi:D-psicose/D-tagatose/L-ribulose 3-epimerase
MGASAAPRLDVACHLNVLVAGIDAPGFDAALDALAEIGYTRVVLPPVDPGALDAAEFGRRFAERGLIPVPIAGQGPEADVSSDDAGVRAAGADALREMVKFTAAIGGDQLNGVLYGPFGRAPHAPDAHAMERSATLVGSVADAAERDGVRLTFEVLNRYETAMLNTAAQARTYLRLAGSRNLFMHLDTFHMAIEEADMAAAVRESVPVLGYLELGQSGRGPLGAGVVDVEQIVRVAWAAGYRGPIGVEAFSAGILSPVANDILAIWRSPFSDGVALAREAMGLIRRGVDAAGDR